MKVISKSGVITNLDGRVLEVCEPYQMGKQYRMKFAICLACGVVPLELVHTEVWGSALVLTRNGVRYFLTLIGEFLGKVWVYLFRKKSKIFSKLRVRKTEVEKGKVAM